MISEPGGICLKNVPFKQNPDTVFFSRKHNPNLYI